MKKKVKFVIIIVIAILSILLLILLGILNIYSKKQELEFSNNIPTNVEVTTYNNKSQEKTIKEIIEESGSTYISENRKVRTEVSLIFKYDLFDENGKNRKTYFYDIISQIEEIEKRTFLLTDTEKSIEVYALYNPETKEYKIYINGVENYFDKVDGEIYLELSHKTEFRYSDLYVDNNLIKNLGMNSMHFAGTELDTKDRENLDNGYTSYNDGTILARLQNGQALNVIFRNGYDKRFTIKGIYVGTPLSEILEKYPKNNFGSIREGYLGYITEYAYIFFYENEVSVYPYQRKNNKYFDEYITNYCISNNLEQLVSDFTTDWTSYFENSSNLENESFKISFPVRGIKIDITNNNSTGITIYSNYQLSQEIKDLIIAKKITLKTNEDLVDVTEKARRESM